MPEALPEYARLHMMHCVCRQLPCQVVQCCCLQCAGFYIIPRSPTEVYYDVSTEAVEAELYNWFYCCNTTANANCPKGAPLFPHASSPCQRPGPHQPSLSYQTPCS